MAKMKIAVGRQVVVPAGTRVTTRGETVKRGSDAVVTIREIETTRAGNTKITWKSNGYRATAVLKG